MWHLDQIPTNLLNLNLFLYKWREENDLLVMFGVGKK
jgi:hypothetical protein